MCRNIKRLRFPDGPATREEIEASARQFVRKVSGLRKPSRINSEAFETAVDEISNATERMLLALELKGRQRQVS